MTTPGKKIQSAEREGPARRWLLVGALIFATLIVAIGPPAPIFAQLLPPNTFQLSIHSQPGDPWSRTTGKSDWLYHAAMGSLFVKGSTGLAMAH